MNGKRKCKILKQIRQQIAQANDIRYITSECKHQGDCPGTCPKCEAEVRYLEEELKKHRNAGKAVAVAGIATALMLTGCQSGGPAATAPQQTQSAQSTSQEMVDGEVICETDPTETLPELMGEPLVTEDVLAGAPPPPSDGWADHTFPPGVQGEIPIEEP